MKNLLIMGTLLLSMNSFGKQTLQGNEKGNGGDICENKMRDISNDIESWLINENYKGIVLPKNLTDEDYKLGMLEAVKNSLLSCTAEKLLIGSAEKTCVNHQDINGDKRIVCNFDRFLKTEDDQKYKLLHHEFAGVAGFETNNGQEKSSYVISNQVTGFLKKEIVTRLGIKNTITNTCGVIISDKLNLLDNTTRKVTEQLKKNGFDLSNSDSSQYNLKKVSSYCHLGFGDPDGGSCTEMISYVEIENLKTNESITLRGIDRGGIFLTASKEKSIRNLLKNLPSCEKN